MCATDLGSCVRRMSGWPGLALRGTSGGGASCTCHVDPQLALIQPSPRTCAGGGGGGRLARDAASLGLGGSDMECDDGTRVGSAGWVLVAGTANAGCMLIGERVGWAGAGDCCGGRDEPLLRAAGRAGACRA